MRSLDYELWECRGSRCCWEAAAGSVVSSLIGAGTQIYTQGKAADAQQKAAQQAIQAQIAAAQQAQAYQREMLGQAEGYLQPYRDFGQAGVNQLTDRLPELTSPINMDEATLQQTPGYQFAQKQGLRAVQQSMIPRGLRGSGAVLKGVLDYSTGLADQTYQNQFNNANTNQTNAFNRLFQIASGGQNAATQSGGFASTAGGQGGTQLISTGQGVANSLIGAGNAQGASYVGQGNAAAGGLNNAANAYANYEVLNRLTGGMYGYPGGYGTSGAGAP